MNDSAKCVERVICKLTPGHVLGVRGKKQWGRDFFEWEKSEWRDGRDVQVEVLELTVRGKEVT